MRYWNPNKEACYIERQLPLLKEEDRKVLVEIADEYWDNLIEKNASDNMLIVNDPVKNIPIVIPYEV